MSDDRATRNDIEMRNNSPQGKFKISKQNLITIVSKCQERTFAEDVDMIDEIGGDRFLETALCTSFKMGIPGDENDLRERESVFATNRKPLIKPKSFLELLCGALEDFTLRILLVASILSIAIEVGTAKEEERKTKWVDGFAIFVAVLICATVASVNDYQKERQFQKLNQVADDRKQVSLMRGGNLMNIHMSEVMVGDIVLLSEGMEVPADGYVFESADVTTDESAMTGEIEPIKKNIISECIKKRDQIMAEGGKNTATSHDVPSPILMSGTRVFTGEGKFMIVVVGDSSCIGKINALLRGQEPEITPLQQKLEAIARDIGKFGLTSSCIILLVLLTRFTIERTTSEGTPEDPKWNSAEHWRELLGFFIIAITVVVVAIPEGLPLSVTISLAYSVKKMLKDQNLVRKLQACETMGGANMVCSDKTGTLTQNKMTLTTLWNEKLIDLDTYSQSIQINSTIPKELEDLFLQSTCCNSSANLRPKETGSKTEVAILQYIDRCQIRYESVREKYHPFMKFPFSSMRKRMGIVIELENGKKRLLEKGASEMVLEACSQFHSFDNKIQRIDSTAKARMEKAIEEMATRALRTICVAYRDLDGSEDLHSKDDKGVYTVEKKDLTLLCIFGIKDILRQEVPEAVQQCKKAGIKVRMVTGDNKLTAKAIAKECGIIEAGDENSLVMEGVDFIAQIGGVVCKNCRTIVCDCPRDKESAKKEGKKIRVDTIAKGEEFDKIYPHLDVLARSRPEDKYALVTGLLERGHVVAVTGDGTNDAPALKKADVGFAMGIAGTEVAREAAAIILLDDNFSSIVKAALWGRNIYDSIRKFLQFQLTVNCVAVISTFVGAATYRQEIFHPIQLLWMNLIMDTFASLALATEQPEVSLLDRPPHNRNEYIVSKKMFKHIVGQALFQLCLIFLFFFHGHNFLPEYEDEFDDYLRQKIKSNGTMEFNMDLQKKTFWHIKYNISNFLMF
jgi:P-type Ca2+ transporter type 2B